MNPTTQPQSDPSQQPQAAPSFMDLIHKFLFGQAPLAAAAQQGGPALAPSPQPTPQSGGSSYLQDAVNKYMAEQSKSMANKNATPNDILAGPPKKRASKKGE